MLLHAWLAKVVGHVLDHACVLLLVSSLSLLSAACVIVSQIAPALSVEQVK